MGRRRDTTVKSQSASDLHLEFERRPEDRLKRPVAAGTTAIVLAGDIHSMIEGMDDLIRKLAKQAPVVIVAGNHEFFGRDLHDTHAQLAGWAAAIRDVHFLPNRA